MVRSSDTTGTSDTSPTFNAGGRTHTLARVRDEHRLGIVSLVHLVPRLIRLIVPMITRTPARATGKIRRECRLCKSFYGYVGVG